MSAGELPQPIQVDPDNVIATEKNLANGTKSADTKKTGGRLRGSFRGASDVGGRGNRQKIRKYPKRKPTIESTEKSRTAEYREQLANRNAINLERSRFGRDIAGDYPRAINAERRAASRGSLRLFCETYGREAFPLAWSDDHLKALGKLASCIVEGGLFALAMPRGGGKTTLVVYAALWALLYRYRRFVCLIGSTEALAKKLLEHVKTLLSFNELLAEDFPEVCHAIRRLENQARRAGGQIFDGRQTLIHWTETRLTFPTMPDSACFGENVSGSTITVAGLTGALRGQSHTLASGEIIRPELVILDDPQTRESAMSAAQSIERAAIIHGDVLGMAGPKKRIAAVIPCTVIRQGDMADILLDRDQSPRWQGERFRLLYSYPAEAKLWERYAELRRDSLRNGNGGAEATAFYRENREAMDAGAVAAWPARFNADELSAVQSAMNLRIDNEASFYAEFQNDPIEADRGDGPQLTADVVAGKLNGLPRLVAHERAEHITAFIDVHDAVLYYAVVGWSGDFTGWILDYGAWPDQGVQYFLMRRAPRTIGRAFPGAGREGSIRAAIEKLVDVLASRPYRREDGAELRIGRILIDAGYVPDVVFDIARHSRHAAVITPSRGVGIGASAKPMSEYTKRRGDRLGFNWYMPRPQLRAGPRPLRFDANFWKSFTAARILVALGDPGSLSLWGRSSESHRMVADHCCAELPVRTAGQGRQLDEWRLRPDKPDNHLWDCLVGAAVAASLVGVERPGGTRRPAGARSERRRGLTMRERRDLARQRAGGAYAATT